VGKVSTEDEYAVGDRVKTPRGLGTVVYIDHGLPLPYLVEHDKAISGGHDGEGRCEDERGWWCTMEDLTRIAEVCPEPFSADKTGNVDEATVSAEGEFSVGGRVITRKGKGTLVYMDPKAPLPYLVDHDAPFPNGHTGKGKCKEGCGWRYTLGELKHLREEGVTLKPMCEVKYDQYAVGDLVDTERGPGAIIRVDSADSLPYLVKHDEAFANGHNGNHLTEACPESPSAGMAKGKKVEAEHMNDYAIGDRVKTSKGLGTIVKIDKDDVAPYLVDHDEAIPGGHSGNGKCRDGHGFWYLEGRIEKWCDLGKAENNIKDEEEKSMNFSKLFGTNMVGHLGTDKFKGSIYGLAIRTQDGGYVTWDGTAITDVSDFTFDGDTVIAVPAFDVTVGDLILKGDTPLYVEHKYADGSLRVVNPAGESKETYIPKQTPFGVKVYIKVWSMMASMAPKGIGALMSGEGTANQNAILLPIMMSAMSGKSTGSMNKLLPLMMMTQNTAGGDMSKMLLPLMMMGDGKSGDDMMNMFMMMQAMGTLSKPQATE
jgi:hypothetical protein